MGSKFKPGDRVKYIGGSRSTNPPNPDTVYMVRKTPSYCDGVFLEEHNRDFWYNAEYFKLVEPDPRAVPGIPEGYRLVRIGPPKEGELLLDWHGRVLPAPSDYEGANHVVLEKTTKTERLWIVVDLYDGTTSMEWVADGANYLTSSRRYNAIETRQTREVPA